MKKASIILLAILPAFFSCHRQDEPSYTPDEQIDRLESAAEEFLSEFDSDKWGDAFDLMQSFMDHIDALEEDYPGATDVFKKGLREGETHLMALSTIPGGVYEEKDHSFQLVTAGKADEIGIIAYPDGKKARMDIRYGPEGKQYRLKGVNLDILDEFGDDPVYIKVPSWVEITFFDDASTRIVWLAHLNPADSNNDNTLNPDDDAISSDLTATLEDYTLSFNEITFFSDGRHSIFGILKKDKKILSRFSSKLSVATQSEVQISWDVLGSVQIQGGIDPVPFRKYWEECDRFSSNLKSLQQSVTMLNKTIGLGLYYDGGSVRQARLAYDVFRDGDGLQTWHITPVFTFDDGSSRAWDDFSEGSRLRSIADKLLKWTDRIKEILNRE